MILIYTLFSCKTSDCFVVVFVDYNFINSNNLFSHFIDRYILNKEKIKGKCKKSKQYLHIHTDSNAIMVNFAYIYIQIFLSPISHIQQSRQKLENCRPVNNEPQGIIKLCRGASSRLKIFLAAQSMLFGFICPQTFQPILACNAEIARDVIQQ